jgi:hypothetical protein
MRTFLGYVIVLGVPAVLLWRSRWNPARWPWLKCPKCKGKKGFSKGRYSRDCPRCGGSGRRLRLGARRRRR